MYIRSSACAAALISVPPSAMAFLFQLLLNSSRDDGHHVHLVQYFSVEQNLAIAGPAAPLTLPSAGWLEFTHNINWLPPVCNLQEVHVQVQMLDKKGTDLPCAGQHLQLLQFLHQHLGPLGELESPRSLIPQVYWGSS